MNVNMKSILDDDGPEGRDRRHSSQLVDVSGTLVAPSQQTGKCETTYATDGIVVGGGK
jgi:hypothetical protein